ncbi:MAG: type II secretion system protein GspN [Candidatus Binatia bacterium]|nr:type II secretion system protein GspN [Candidatus Binatia bacterium]
MRFWPIPLPQLGIPEFLTRKLFWLYAGYTFVVFLIALAFTFPHDLLIRRALHSLDRGPLPLRVQGAGLSVWKGYQLTGLRIGGAEDGRPPLLELSSVWARPLWSEWARGNVYAAKIGAELYGGLLDGALQYREAGLNGVLTWQRVQLGRYRALQSQLEEGQITGAVAGNIAFELRGTAFQQGQANGELVVDNLRLSQAKISGWPVPDLEFKQVKSKIRVSPGKVELTDISASGDLIIQGSGQITLREPYGESLLNLRLTVAPGTSASDTVKAVLALLPKPAGGKPDAPVTVSGTLAHPKIR